MENFKNLVGKLELMEYIGSELGALRWLDAFDGR